MPDLSSRQAAKLAGFGLLFMFIAGIFASGPQTTVYLDQILGSPSKLSRNIIGNLMMLVFDTVAALGLYVLLKPVNKSVSLLSSWFRLLHVAVYGASTFFLLYALEEINLSKSIEGSLSPEQIGLIKSYLKGNEYGFQIGTFFFGFHFIALGYLILISRFIPRWIGISLLIVSTGYLANSMLSFLHPDYDHFKTTFQIAVFLPAMVAEFLLCIWLLFKNDKVPELLNSQNELFHLNY